MSSMAPTRTRVKTSHLYFSIILAICPLVFIGAPFAFLKGIVTGNTRWYVLAMLIVYLFFKRNLIRYLDKRFTSIIFLYTLWCFFTTAWSSVITLSFVRSIILMIVIIPMISAGIEWVRTRSLDNCLNYLWLLAFSCLITCYLGMHNTEAFVIANNNRVMIYKGLMGQANMLGSMLMMSSPYLLWKTYRAWPHLLKRIVWGSLFFSCLFFIILTISRSAILAELAIIFIFFASFSLNKKIFLILFGIVCLIGFFTTVDNSTLVDLSNKYIYKNSVRQDLLATRLGNWQRTFEGFQEAGWFGAGYGAAVDESFDLSTRLSQDQSGGKEKSNSILAVMEEIGLVGLILYLLIFSVIFHKFFHLYAIAPTSQLRVLVGILFGTFVGMFIHSMFESWWTAAGSPESAYFWILIGVMRGVEIVFKQHKMQLKTEAIASFNANQLAQEVRA